LTKLQTVKRYGNFFETQCTFGGGGFCSYNGMAWCKIHFASKSCIILYWQRYCTALEQWASAKLCGVVSSRDRAAIPFDIRRSNCLHRVSKNVPPLACYNFDAREWILIFFGRNVTDEVGNQKTLYYATSSNLCCFCTTCQMGKHENHIFHSIGLCYTHNAPVRCLPERIQIVICDVFDSV